MGLLDWITGGSDDDTPKRYTCSECGGTGHVFHMEYRDSDGMQVPVSVPDPCPVCRGNGTVQA